MEGFILILIIYVLLYCGYIVALAHGITKVKAFEVHDKAPQTTFSIIIPFRNEDQNLRRFLESIAALDYPTEKFELLFVDDFSEDFSVNVINKWRMQNGKIQTTLLENLRLSSSPKKDAISRAVPVIENQWIITTDADCIVPTTWLKTFNDYILANDVNMIAAPVAYDGKLSFLHHFQRLDMLSLQGVTMGSFGIGNPFMCNGANFAYTKKSFTDLGGFAGNNSVASGDDVFLLQKAVLEDISKVHYLKSKNAIVKSKPVNSWFQLLQQRVRWGSKTSDYRNYFGVELAMVTLLGNFAIVLLAILAIFEIIDWRIAVAVFAVKSVPDVVLLFKTNRFLNNGRFFFPLFSAIFYPFFCVTVVLVAVFGKYEWKGRNYKR